VAYCHAAYTVGLALNGILFLSSSRCIGGAFVAFFLSSQVYIQNLGFDMLCLLPFHDARNYQGHPTVRGVTLVSNILFTNRQAPHHSYCKLISETQSYLHL
jgi:hypothetical protein